MLTAFDIDGVLANCADAINAFHNGAFATNLKYDDITHYDLWRIWKCSRIEGARRMEMFFDSHYFDEMQPYPEMKKVVRDYANRGKAITMTSRPARVEAKTNKWLETHYPKDFYANYHTGDKYDSNGECDYRSKELACEELGVDLLFEDCIETAVKVAEVGTDVMLVDRPWNRYVPEGVAGAPDNIFRIYL
ncbi:MAG: hypothetical protein QXU82_02300 [Candidatus Aenigmatarchaeota archaeon]